MRSRGKLHPGQRRCEREQGPHDADQAHAKATLAQCVVDLIQSMELTQSQAAEWLAVDQPKISRLLRGQFDEFSTSRLFRFLTLLGQDIEIVVRVPEQQSQRQIGRLRVVAPKEQRL